MNDTFAPSVEIRLFRAGRLEGGQRLLLADFAGGASFL